MPVEGYLYPAATSNNVSQTASFTQGTGGTDYPTTTTYVAFRISTGAAFTSIGHVSVFMYKDAGITTGSTIQAELYTEVAGAPGVLVALSGSVPDHATGYLFYPHNLGAGPGYTEVKFFLPITGLTPATNYWVVLSNTFSGGQVHLDTQVSGSNLLATSANKVAWAGVLREPRYVVYPATALAVAASDADNFAIYASSDNYMALRGSSVSGFGVYGISTFHYGVGGNSEYLTGVRGSSNYGMAVHGESLNLTGGMFQADAGVFPALQGAHLSIGAGVQGFSTGGDYLQAANITGIGWRIGTNFETLVHPTGTIAYGSTHTTSCWTEEITLSLVATTTDSATDIPAGSEVLAVCWYVTQTITTAANFSIGTAADPVNFQIATTSIAVTNSGVGINHKATAGKVQGFDAATKVRITTNVNPGAGKVRLVVWYRVYGAPTS